MEREGETSRHSESLSLSTAKRCQFSVRYFLHPALNTARMWCTIRPWKLSTRAEKVAEISEKACPSNSANSGSCLRSCRIVSIFGRFTAGSAEEEESSSCAW